MIFGGGPNFLAVVFSSNINSAFILNAQMLVGYWKTGEIKD